MASSPFLRPLPTFLLFILLVLLLDLFSSTTAFFLPCPSSSQLQQQQKQCGGITRRGSGRPAAVIKLRATARDDKGKEEEITGLEGTNEGMVSRRHRRTPALEEQREMRASRAQAVQNALSVAAMGMGSAIFGVQRAQALEGGSGGMSLIDP
ncbi:hypothetical protein VYU27_009587, partial [Nannochloropsis oceanica]